MMMLMLSMLSLVGGTAEAQMAVGAREPIHARGLDAASDESQDKREVLAVLKRAVEEVLMVLRDPELERDAKRDGVVAIIEPLIDFELLAMLSLGKTHWSRINAEQRVAFTELFVETLKISYFEKLLLFSEETVEFEEPVALQTRGAPKYLIQSYVVSKGNRVKVTYEMARREGKWKAFDFEIEGVSVRKSYGAQYNDFLREQSFDQLLDTMRKKLEEARQKEPEQG